MGVYLCDMQPKKPENMNNTIVITPNVINTLRSLPYDRRLSVASALAGEMLLGAGLADDMDAEDAMVYSILRFYVRQASERYNKA